MATLGIGTAVADTSTTGDTGKFLSCDDKVAAIIVAEQKAAIKMGHELNALIDANRSVLKKG